MKFFLYNKDTSSDYFISYSILGLGFNYEEEKSSFIMKLLNQKYINSPVFSIYFSESNRDSKLYLDDQSKNQNFAHIYKEMNYCDVISKSSNYWECELKGVIILDNKTNFTNKRIIFQTSTTFLIIPSLDFALISPQFIGDNTCSKTDLNQLICKCKSPNTFNDIRIIVNNGTIKIESKYIIDFEPYHEYQCRFQIIIDNNFNNSWIIGDSALRGMFVSFDYSKGRIGFNRNLFFQELLKGEKHTEDVKIYYFVMLVVICFVMVWLYRWANSDKSNNVILVKNKNEILDKENKNMFLLEDK